MWRNILDLVLKMFLPLPPENNILTKAPNFTFQQQGFPSLHLVVGGYFIFVFSFRSSDACVSRFVLAFVHFPLDLSVVFLCVDLYLDLLISFCISFFAF